MDQAKSLYAKYKEEREGAVVVESEHGFASAVPFGDFWYIDDIYVMPEYRKSHIASDLADKLCTIGAERGFKKILGSVDPKANGATTSLKVLLGYDMKLLDVKNEIIYFTKDL